MIHKQNSLLAPPIVWVINASFHHLNTLKPDLHLDLEIPHFEKIHFGFWHSWQRRWSTTVKNKENTLSTMFKKTLKWVDDIDFNLLYLAENYDQFAC